MGSDSGCSRRRFFHQALDVWFSCGDFALALVEVVLSAWRNQISFSFALELTYLAARRAQQEHAGRLRRHLEVMEGAIQRKDLDLLSQEDVEFHLALADICRTRGTGDA